MAFLPGTRQLVTAGMDRCLRIWETEPAKLPIILRGHTHELRAITVAADGTIFCVSRDGVIEMWSPDLVRKGEFLSPGHKLVPVGLSADGQTAVTVGDGVLKFWEVRRRELPELLSRRWAEDSFKSVRMDADRMTQAISISPDLNWLALVRTDQPSRLWNVDQRMVTRELSSSEHSHSFAVFSLDSRWLAVPGSSNSVDLWNTTKGERAAIIPASDVAEPVISFAASAPVLALGPTNAILVWHVEKGSPLRRLNLRAGFCPALSPDGSLLATGNSEGEIRVYDCASGTELQRLSGHFSGIERVCFSPDGRTLVSASRQLVKFWNVTTWREMGSNKQEARVLILVSQPMAAPSSRLTGPATSSKSGGRHSNKHA